MKKVLSVLFAVFAVGIASLLLFTPADTAVYALLQRFFPARLSPSLVLIPIDDDSLQTAGAPSLSSENARDAMLLAQELGAKSFLFDMNFKNPVVSVDSLVQKEKTSQEKQTSLFNIKIVIPGKSVISEDSKTPEHSSLFFKIDSFPLTSFSENAFLAGNIETNVGTHSVLVKKNGAYYADAALASAIDFLGVQSIKVSDSAIVLESHAKSIKLPRERDGSIRLKYPRASWKNYNTVRFSDLQALAAQEKKFISYLSLMEERGFFSDLPTENPLAVYRQSRSLLNDRAHYRTVKQQFYALMTQYLSGRQERVLTEAVSDAEHIQTIETMFATCRHFLSEIETARVKLSEKLDGALCVFALCADSSADFTKTPFETHVPRAVESFVLANMVVAGDVISASVRILSLVSAIVLCSFVLFVLFFSIAYSSETKRKHHALSNNFSQAVPDSLCKKIRAKPTGYALDGQKSEATVLASSLANVQVLETVLNETQLLAFLNYYVGKVSARVVQYGGIVESYRNDEVIALFGAPVASEKHSANAVACAVSLKELDRDINADIHMYPQSPKADGMTDDLYTAFFILNHNNRKIATRIGVYSGTVTSGCLGSHEKRAYRIIDDSWKKAVSIKDASRVLGNFGVLINERIFERVRDDFIIRKLGDVAESDGEKLSVSEILADRSSDDEKLWNYAMYWNKAVALLQVGEGQKALGVFKKLAEGRSADKVAAYFIKSINEVE